jgi:hypothetical protein
LLLQRIGRVEEFQARRAEVNMELVRKADVPDARALSTRVEPLDTKRKEHALRHKETHDKPSGLENTNQYTPRNNEISASRTGTAAQRESRTKQTNSNFAAPILRTS